MGSSTYNPRITGRHRQDTYSVEDFGAIGNGSHVDGVAIQDAIDTAYANGGGKVVGHGGKSYYTTTQIVVKAGVIVDLLGNPNDVNAGCEITSDANIDIVKVEAGGFIRGGKIRAVSGGSWTTNDALLLLESTGASDAFDQIGLLSGAADIALEGSTNSSAGDGLVLRATGSGAHVQWTKFYNINISKVRCPLRLESTNANAYVNSNLFDGIFTRDVAVPFEFIETAGDIDSNIIEIHHQHRSTDTGPAILDGWDNKITGMFWDPGQSATVYESIVIQSGTGGNRIETNLEEGRVIDLARSGGNKVIPSHPDKTPPIVKPQTQTGEVYSDFPVFDNILAYPEEKGYTLTKTGASSVGAANLWKLFYPNHSDNISWQYSIDAAGKMVLEVDFSGIANQNYISTAGVCFATNNGVAPYIKCEVKVSGSYTTAFTIINNTRLTATGKIPGALRTGVQAIKFTIGGAFVASDTYTKGMVVIDDTDDTFYKHITATSSLATVPSSDTTNWESLGITGTSINPSFIFCTGADSMGDSWMKKDRDAFVSPVELYTNTIAGLNSKYPASSHTNKLAVVTDDVLGVPVLVISDGTNWKRQYDGATASTT